MYSDFQNIGILLKVPSPLVEEGARQGNWGIKFSNSRVTRLKFTRLSTFTRNPVQPVIEGCRSNPVKEV